MASTIVGEFKTRRSSELAIERIVQELGIARDDVSVRPMGDLNTAGTKTAGTDAKTTPAPKDHAKREGFVEVTVKPGSIEEGLKARGSPADHAAVLTTVRENWHFTGPASRRQTDRWERQITHLTSLGSFESCRP